MSRMMLNGLVISNGVAIASARVYPSNKMFLIDD